MNITFLAVATLVLLPVAVADLVFLAEVLAGLSRPRSRQGVVLAPRRIAIVMPAHNEEQTLPRAAEMLGALRAASVRVLVVADNCSDATAETARSLGCEVAERVDPDLRGKGFALAFGRDRLAADPPDVAIVLDADCAMDVASVLRLAEAAASSGRAVQAAYLFRARPSEPPMVQISNFAIVVKNLVRQRGGRRLGAAALLNGTGMAFPWPLFATLELATADIVEDLALGVELVRRGAPPRFEEGAQVWSDASTGEGTATQRARWEAGFMATARALAPGLIAGGVSRGRWAELWMGLHLLVPPLALLVAVNLGLFALFFTLVAFGLPLLPAAVSGVLLIAVAGAVVAAWAAEGRRYLSGSVALRLPLYVLWKLKLHGRLAAGRERAGWIRTERKDG